jgi:nicotinate dehydrogenase subunit B
MSLTTTAERVVPPHVATNPRLGTWIRVENGAVLVHVGKVELGQGILTALAQIAADALGLPISSVRVVPATTSGPDQGLTAGSMSVFQSFPALRHVGAVVRTLAGPPGEAYVDRIAGLDPDLDLTTIENAPDLVAQAVGTDAARSDLSDKVLGRPRYLTDLRPEGLLHGRVLRPPSPAAVLAELPDDWSAPGISLVRDGSFIGVVGEHEDEVDRALAALAQAARWDERDPLPDEDDLCMYLRSAPSEPQHIVDESPGEPSHTASYSKPYLAHASIAPSCAMARWSDDGSALHLWSHSQGIHRLRSAVAGALDLEAAAVSVEHVENAGCYGHNAADDAAFDAVLLARAVPGRPVLLRWTRADELTWAPLSPAMTATVSARLVGGRIEGWSYDVFSSGHTSRPLYAGQPGLLASAHRAGGAPLPPADDPSTAAGHGTLRNGQPIYDVGPRRISGHRLTVAPLRTSAMRSLGAFFNVFAIESFMDEVATDAGLDPVDFRLAHLTDRRARAVVELAADASGWGEPLPASVGRGMGFARYKDKGAWCAVVAEVEAESEVRVRRLTVAADLGLLINPDGARNQLSGGAVQATSWTTIERVRFDRRRVTSNDWQSYPILRFRAAPRVDVHLVASDEQPLGAGEAAQGPTAAAIANALHAALGVRVRDLPLTREAIVRTIESEE